METKNTYLRELHSLLEGCAFIWLVLCGFVSWVIKISPYYFIPERAGTYHLVYAGGAVLLFLILYLMIAMFSKIQSLAVECAVAAWVFYISLVSIAMSAIPGKNMELFGNTATALTIGIVAATGIIVLIGLLWIALRRGKKYDDESVYHSLRYKIYRFLRGAALVFAAFSFIGYFNQTFVFHALIGRPEYAPEISWTSGTFNWSVIKEHVEVFSYFVQRVALIFGVEGIVLIGAGFLTSIFALSVELIVIGWLLLAFVGSMWWFLYVVIPAFGRHEVATWAELLTKGAWDIVVYELVWVILSLLILWLLIRLYIQRTNKRLHN